MINLDLLNEMINNGYVAMQKHPEHELFIYNYTPKAQYEYHWNEVTLACRGLILDDRYRVVSRPFAKFFNLGETENQFIPNEPFEVFEKLDGSLGILYWVDQEPFIATRGSFTGEQAKMASAILRAKYMDAVQNTDRTKTYLFEIIYPDNRIVVDYGGIEDLFLIAVIDNATGQDLPLPDIGFPLAGKYHGIRDVHTLKAMEEANREGFVIKYRSGLRYKVKFDQYLQLHRTYTNMSNIVVWEYLAAGRPFDDILDILPDELYDWVKMTADALKMHFEAIETQCKEDFKVLPTRKETAEYFQTCAYPPILFRMLDGKSYDSLIWKEVKPQFQKPVFNFGV
jgi:T4 RnlA family RNA ligase